MNRDDVIKKEFPHAFIGYDVAEVDLFLDEVIREFDRLHNEIDVLNFRLDRLIAESTQAASMASAGGSEITEPAVKANAEKNLGGDPNAAAVSEAAETVKPSEETAEDASR